MSSSKKPNGMKPFRRHFRWYGRSKHPAFIVGEGKGKYDFHRVTSSPKSGHHPNWKVDPNPQIGRNTPMYIVKNEESDWKRKFSAYELKNFGKFDSSFIRKKSKK